MNSNRRLYDNQIELTSQFYPDLHAHLAPPPHEVKPRRQQRSNRGEQSRISGMKKRKLSQEQVNLLERNFGDEHKLESQRKDRIAAELRLEPRQVAVWFQNRRARYKCKKLEEEYSRLRAGQEKTVVEKCRLEAELMKLKDKLLEAEKEIQRLTESVNTSSGSSRNSRISSSVSTDFPEQLQFLGEYAFDDIIFVPDEGVTAAMAGWVNFCK